MLLKLRKKLSLSGDEIPTRGLKIRKYTEGGRVNLQYQGTTLFVLHAQTHKQNRKTEKPQEMLIVQTAEYLSHAH